MRIVFGRKPDRYFHLEFHIESLGIPSEMSDLRRRNRIDMVVTINVDIFPLKVVLEHQSTGTVQPHTSIFGKSDFSFLQN